MKKNAGMSTIVTTGLGAFIAVFALVLLTILRFANGGAAVNSEAVKEAEAKADAIAASFAADVNAADLEVYWDRVNMAVITIGTNNFSITWREIKSVYHVTLPYDSTAVTDKEKVEQAKQKTQNMFVVLDENDPAYEELRAAKIAATAKPLATGVRNFYVDTTSATDAKLQLKIEYFNKNDQKTELIDKEYTQKYTAGAASRKEANQ